MCHLDQHRKFPTKIIGCAICAPAFSSEEPVPDAHQLPREVEVTDEEFPADLKTPWLFFGEFCERSRKPSANWLDEAMFELEELSGAGTEEQ